MKLLRIPFVLLIAVTPAAAQVSSAPGVCFAFNTNTIPATTQLPLVAGGDLYFGFTAPVTATIEQIDIAASVPIATVVTVQVFQWTGTALGPLLGSGTSLPPTFNGTMSLIPLILSPPLTVFAGSSYALRLTLSVGFLFVVGNPSQPTPIPYLLNCGPTGGGFFPPCSTYATSGTYRPWLSFRANACGQIPYAVATQIGVGCGAPPTVGNPYLYTFTPPVLGTPFTFSVLGYFGVGGTIHVFWAAGPATAGLNLGLGGGCTSYLDPISLQTLNAAGLEPLVIFPGTAATNTTTVSIPPNPGLAGATVTTQALVYASTGVPTPLGNIQISNALQLSLGY